MANAVLSNEEKLYLINSYNNSKNKIKRLGGKKFVEEIILRTNEEVNFNNWVEIENCTFPIENWIIKETHYFIKSLNIKWDEEKKIFDPAELTSEDYQLAKKVTLDSAVKRAIAFYKSNGNSFYGERRDKNHPLANLRGSLLEYLRD